MLGHNHHDVQVASVSLLRSRVKVCLNALKPRSGSTDVTGAPATKRNRDEWQVHAFSRVESNTPSSTVGWGHSHYTVEVTVENEAGIPQRITTQI
jgi:hypothetical protein